MNITKTINDNVGKLNQVRRQVSPSTDLNEASYQLDLTAHLCWSMFLPEQHKKSSFKTYFVFYEYMHKWMEKIQYY